MKPHEIFYNNQHEQFLLRMFLSIAIELNEKLKDSKIGVQILASGILFVFNGKCFESQEYPGLKIPTGKEFEDWRKRVEVELKIIDHINNTLDKTIGRPNRY